MDDYQSDVQFGEWLRKERERAGLSLEHAAQLASLEIARLKALEVGYAERGITHSEAKKLSSAYKIPLEVLLLQAGAT